VAVASVGTAGVAASTPSFREAFGTFARIGLLSFGGPAGQIALMHRILVDEKRWLDERTFLNALSFCTLLPGPEAMQLATYSGWRLHGVKGGLAAGLLFVLPGAVMMLALSMLYAAYAELPLLAALFLGIKAAVLAIVIQALIRVARRALKLPVDWLIAASAFIAIYFLKVPFPVIIAAAALVGLLVRSRLDSALNAEPSVLPPVSGSVTVRGTLSTVAVWLGVWIVPLAAVAVAFGGAHVLTDLAVFFSKLAVVTFGGAYAVLAYMSQEVVQRFGWLAPGEMLDGLGLAETTLGPAILVTEFVGFLSAFRNAGGWNPWVMGTLGAIVTLWATFAPCFLWIFAGAPYVEKLNAMPRLRSALAAVTASVVGVILNLAVWFSIHVLFGSVETAKVWPLAFEVPVISAVDWRAAALSAVSFALLFAVKRSVIEVLAVCSGLAVAMSLAGV
jgi:chromate transporter